MSTCILEGPLPVLAEKSSQSNLVRGLKLVKATPPPIEKFAAVLASCMWVCLWNTASSCTCCFLTRLFVLFSRSWRLCVVLFALFELSLLSVFLFNYFFIFGGRQKSQGNNCDKKSKTRRLFVQSVGVLSQAFKQVWSVNRSSCCASLSVSNSLLYVWSNIPFLLSLPTRVPSPHFCPGPNLSFTSPHTARQWPCLKSTCTYPKHI